MTVLDDLFKDMKAHGASDLHLYVGLPPILRLNGKMVRTKKPVLTEESARELIYGLLSEEQIGELEKRMDYDFAYDLDGIARVRCNILFNQRGLGAVFRIIPKDILTIKQLNLPDTLAKIANFRKGLVVVTGPTGSGKSTTLAAIIDHINKTREVHILTIEDPIEFVHPKNRCLITQREVGVHTHSVVNALQRATREDPDIIVVGEMHDSETISIALTCASLGVLVFGTHHTNNAAKTIDRLVDAFPANQQNKVRSILADSLMAVVAQQLLVTSDGNGRCAANEILLGSSALANLIREGKTSQVPSLIQTGTSMGMQTMDQGLMKMINEGKITKETACEKATDKSHFESTDSETES
jgi:twitching motility protein PilT